MKRSIVGLAVTASLLLVSFAHAQATTAPIGNPYTDTIQLWSEIAGLLAYVEHDAATAFFPSQPPSAAATPEQQTASLAEAVASFETPTATSTIATTTTSDQTTLSQNVKSAKLSSAESSTQTPILSDPTPAFNPSNFVTQAELTQQLLALSNSLTATFGPPATTTPPQYVAADGNGENPFAAANAINNLSGVTITDPTISGGSVNATSFSGTLGVGNGGTGWTTINAGSILFGNGSSALATSSNLFWNNADSSLGIGSTSPDQALGVNGNVDLEGGGTYDIGNVPVLFASSTLTSTFIGYNTLSSALAQTASADAALGYGALGLVTTGHNDTAVGYNALAAVTTDVNLTAIGGNALASATSSASHSTAVGFNALELPPKQYAILPRMAAKKTTLNEIGDMLTHVVKHMATKDDLAAVEARLDKRIDKLEGRFDGFEAKVDRLDTKLGKFEDSEIDKRKQLEVRVAAIEKHLGLGKKIAA